MTTTTIPIGSTVTIYQYDIHGAPAGTLTGTVIGYVGANTLRVEVAVPSGRQVFHRTPAQFARTQ